MDNEEKIENNMMEGLRPDEVKILMENQIDIEKAIKMKKRLDHSLIALVAIELTTLLCYLLVFIIMDDHAWFDWVDLAHIFLALVLILCVTETLNVYRNLKYLLVMSLFLFALDIIISAYLRPLTIERANPLNVRKVDLKEALLALQAMLTVVDFLAFSLALYFRYFSPLSDGDVHSRFLDIELARQKYQKTAILAHLTAEGRELKIQSMTRRTNDFQKEYLAQQERERFAAKYSEKAIPDAHPLFIAAVKKLLPSSASQTPKKESTTQPQAQAPAPAPAPQLIMPVAAQPQQAQPKKGLKEQFDEMKNRIFPASPLSAGPPSASMDMPPPKVMNTEDYRAQFDQRRRADQRREEERKRDAAKAVALQNLQPKPITPLVPTGPDAAELERRRNIKKLTGEIEQDIQQFKTEGADPEKVKQAQATLNAIKSEYNTRVGEVVLQVAPTGQRMRRFKFDDEDSGQY